MPFIYSASRHHAHRRFLDCYFFTYFALADDATRGFEFSSPVEAIPRATITGGVPCQSATLAPEYAFADERMAGHADTASARLPALAGQAPAEFLDSQMGALLIRAMVAADQFSICFSFRHDAHGIE